MLRFFTSLLFCIVFVGNQLHSQSLIHGTFKDTRIINAHSVETLEARKLNVRITHRFGDIAGDAGGFQTLYGLENATDILIGAEYGATDRATIGLFRTKGAGRMPNGSPGLNQLLNGVLKYRLLWQDESNSMPISLTLLGVASLSTAESIDSDVTTTIRNFDQFAHRIAYHAQVSVARRYTFGLSLQLTGGYTHRNNVLFNDTNGLFSVGGAARMQISKVLGVIVDTTFPISDIRNADNGFYAPIGFGVELDTGGHIFQINVTNATGIMETDFIPYTISNWGDGQYRIGFTISRLFNL